MQRVRYRLKAIFLSSIFLSILIDVAVRWNRFGGVGGDGLWEKNLELKYWARVIVTLGTSRLVSMRAIAVAGRRMLLIEQCLAGIVAACLAKWVTFSK